MPTYDLTLTFAQTMAAEEAQNLRNAMVDFVRPALVLDESAEIEIISPKEFAIHITTTEELSEFDQSGLVATLVEAIDQGMGSDLAVPFRVTGWEQQDAVGFRR
jgi:hypothetical protein